ncbi:hypothetical protein WJX81_008427 [Elliptochloris bilobata]|uniref:Glycosyltransferase family 92 protein n=1 Tax=Elliptochloris bilobata TaxID=381761 RepID=A0AAW1RIE5_9CHLO
MKVAEAQALYKKESTSTVTAARSLAADEETTKAVWSQGASGKIPVPKFLPLEEAASKIEARASGRGPSRRSGDSGSRRPGEGGKRGIVRHFQLPGKFPSGTGVEHVIMHVYIKALQTSEGVTFRGFMFAESVERQWYSLEDTYMCQPFFERASYPGIQLREIVSLDDSAREWNLATYPELLYEHEADHPATGTDERRRICAPVPFEGTLALEDAMRDFQLHVTGFGSYALYAPGKVILKAAPRPKAPEYAPGARIAAVLHPFLHPTPQADVNRVLMHFVAYHIRIGFAQVVHNAQVTYLRGFYADEEVMAAVRAGQLVLQPWTDLAECAGPPHIKCWQPMLYSHAVLDAWGSGTAYLFIADPDEYLVLPNRAAIASVADLLTWCTNDAAQVAATRYNAYCDTQQCSGQGERALWTSARNGSHPLQGYSRRSTVPIKLGKQIVDPERVASYEVHTGVTFSADDRTVLRLNPDCGIVLHVLNQFKRRDFEEYTVADTSWQWALQSLT